MDSEQIFQYDKHIAILGGSYDPITLAHLQVII